MTAYNRARAAYSAVSSGSTRTPRSIEYAVLGRITALLREADAGGPGSFPALAQALEENRQLWSRFAIDVAHPENGLPRELRAKLFYLYEVVQQHTSKVLSRKADAGVLVDINTAVMRGLAGSEIES